MLVAVSCAWAFVLLGDAVTKQRTQKLDERLLLLLREEGRPDRAVGPAWLPEVMRDLTALGSAPVLALVVLAVAGALVVRRERRALVLVLVATAGGEALNLLLKALFDRPRPDLAFRLTAASSASFPSGHAMESAVVYLTLAALLARLLEAPELKRYVLGLAALLSVLVGVSRVYLGVHYPSDVLGGWAAGLAWSIACGAVAGGLPRRDLPGRSLVPVVVAGLAALAPPARAGELDLRGVVSARGILVEGQRSWIDGGYGRLTEGAESSSDAMPAFRGRVQLGLDWRPSPTWLVRAHGTYQGESGESRGRQVGLAEAFAQFRAELDVRTTLRLRAGLFFPPTSLENVDPLWQSPYTITLSAWNTWIGEEVRFTGLDTQLSRDLGTSRLELAAAAFAIAEPSGALLAWRGFGMGDRLTTAGEFLPLPPLRSFEPGEAFGDQTEKGTRPLDELSGRVGWHARARWSHGETALVQGAYTQNGGDRRLHSGQYSWDTHYGQAGVQFRLGSKAVLVAEGALGTTTMGPQAPGGPFVDVRFRTGYALVSWAARGFRLTARADGFENHDRDGTAEPDGESGWAVTTAGFWAPAKWVRLALEYVVLRAERPAAEYSGDDPDTDTRRVQAELRLVF